MTQGFADELRAQRNVIKGVWERRLRAESVTSPMANPDTLVMMMDQTFDELLDTLVDTGTEGHRPRPRGKRDGSGCLCGMNPLLAYFRTFALALCGVIQTGGRRFAEIDGATLALCLDETLLNLRDIAQRDIAAFCSVCQSPLSAGHRGCGRSTAGR